MRRPIAAVSVFVLCVAAPGTVRADGDVEDPQGRIFYREPDSETATLIGRLISKMPTNSVLDRIKARRELESIGFWSVDPLIETLVKREPPFRCDAILVLDVLRDRRAVEPLRAAVLKEASQQYVSGFAALALGRFRDTGAVDVFKAALKSAKPMDMFREAAPFALVKIHTPEARDLLVERVKATGPKDVTDLVKSAALLSLGFFPEVALSADGSRPGPELTAGLASKPRDDRQAALLAFLVAEHARGDVKAFLRDLLATETAPEVVREALVGLSRSAEPDVTEIFAKIVERQGADRVRELAADLLVDRVDAAVKPSIIQTARLANSARLRAACVLALGRVEDDDARRVVAEKLADQVPVVRAAAAVAMTRLRTPALRAEALAALEARIKHGESNEDVRIDFEKARSLLAGERTDVRFTEVVPYKIFADMPLTYVQRLLREVNLRMMASLDLEKIQNLQTDSEVASNGPPSGAGAESGGGAADGGGDLGGSSTSGTKADSGGETPTGKSPPPTDGPSTQPPSSGGDLTTVSVARTSNYQELRDLKVELLRNPYLGFADLPAPTTTPGAPK